MTHLAKRPQRVRFQGHGGTELAGLFQPGRSPSRGTLILCHCFTCSKDFKTLAWLSRALAADGFCVLRFDFAGLGESEGDFRETTLSTDIEDLQAAIRWIELEERPPLAGLVGHSMGGAAAILAARQHPVPLPVAVLGTSCRVGDRIRRLLRPGDLHALELTGETSVSIHGRLYPVTVEFLRDLDRHDLREAVTSWDCPLLVVHGTADRIVPLEEGQRLFEAAAHPKSFLGVPEGDHLFVGRRSFAPAIAQVLAGWIGLYSRDDVKEATDD